LKDSPTTGRLPPIEAMRRHQRDGLGSLLLFN
jgi:hypothetical protein